jgi:hypothetical protein
VLAKKKTADNLGEAVGGTRFRGGQGGSRRGWNARVAASDA